MPLFCAILLCLNIVTFVLLFSGAGHGFLVLGDLKSIDLASIALMAATLVVAGVGVVVGLITFVGYTEIKRSAIRAATERATKVSTDVATAVATRIARGTRPTETDATDAEAIAQAEGE